MIIIHYKKAIEHCNKALELNPKFSFARYTLGIALFELGETDKALEQLREAIRCAEATKRKTLAGEIRSKIENIERSTSELNIKL